MSSTVNASLSKTTKRIGTTREESIKNAAAFFFAAKWGYNADPEGALKYQAQR